MDGWSGAGQRDYHYSMYNKRKFEEVCGINLDMLQNNLLFYAIKVNYYFLTPSPFIITIRDFFSKICS